MLNVSVMISWKYSVQIFLGRLIGHFKSQNLVDFIFDPIFLLMSTSL